MPQHLQSLQAVPEILVSSPLLLWAKITRFTDISGRETRRSVCNWWETTSCSEFKSEKGSCSAKDWIYQTLVINKWFPDLIADHKEALPTCKKEVNGTENKGENNSLSSQVEFSQVGKVLKWLCQYPEKSGWLQCLKKEEAEWSYYCSDPLQQLIHMLAENSKEKLHPRTFPHSIPAPWLYTISHF